MSIKREIIEGFAQYIASKGLFLPNQLFEDFILEGIIADIKVGSILLVNSTHVIYLQNVLEDGRCVGYGFDKDDNFIKDYTFHPSEAENTELDGFEALLEQEAFEVGYVFPEVKYECLSGDTSEIKTPSVVVLEGGSSVAIKCTETEALNYVMRDGVWTKTEKEEFKFKPGMVLTAKVDNDFVEKDEFYRIREADDKTIVIKGKDGEEHIIDIRNLTKYFV